MSELARQARFEVSGETLDDYARVLREHDAALARIAALEAVARDLYSAAVSEHGHDEKHSADWPACLPVHMALNRCRDVVAP